jgi:transcriptional regulator with XRE-family HTH domain
VYQPGRRELADRLKSLREQARISGNQLSKRLGWVQSKVSKIETGKQLPTEDDIRRWVGLIGGGDRVLVELLAMLDRARLEYATWREHFRTAGGASGKQAEIRALEAHATQIREFRPTFISGLVQTATYAEEMLGLASGPLAFGGDQDEVDRMVAIRMQRQHVLYDPRKQIRLVLLEAALHSRVCAPGTLIGQLDRLIGVIGLPALKLGIVPFETQLPIMPFGDFTIYDQDLVVVEGLVGEQHVSEPEEIALYSRFFELIGSVACYGEDAAAVIQRTLDALRSA